MGIYQKTGIRKNLPLIPDYTSEHPCFYYGCKFGEKEHILNIVEYTAGKNIKTFQKDAANYIEGTQEKEYITYQVKSATLLKLGDAVKFKGVKFYVRKAVYELEEGILYGSYQLGRKEHFKQRRYYNKELSGISLNGKVTEVQRDKIKVNLDIDNKKESAKYWFPYSTMSASPTEAAGIVCQRKVTMCVCIFRILMKKIVMLSVLLAVILQRQEVMIKCQTLVYVIFVLLMAWR